MWPSVFVFACVTSVASVNSANILAAIPTVSRSHYVGFEVLIRELINRGHRVTSITTFPQETPLENLREIDVREFRNVDFNNIKFAGFTEVPKSFFSLIPVFTQYLEEVANVFNSTEVKSLISSEEKFDLIILETFLEDVFSGFAHRFDAPVVTISSCYMSPWIVDRFGIPEETAYVPGLFSFYGGNMNFFQRFRNTFLDIMGRLFFFYRLEPLATDISRSVFGSESPAVRDLVSNASLYMVNTHWSLFGARPLPPQVVDVSGIHLRPARPLHSDLDRWMNESSAGVVYFSFGSMLRGATLPADKVRAFLTVFGTLPQRVLWKWEDDAVAADRLPANVKIMKWLPQRDVLAHPKVRLFISHGGLLGTTEAVVSGVPVLGIPMYGDQPNNVAALVERGVAIHLDYNNISVASLTYAFDALLNDKSYSENAKQLSVRFLDRPMSPLDTAVYWTEYVIRHRGAPHLQSAAVHLAWYQYYLLDVAAVFLLAIVLTLATIYYTLRSCLRLVMPTNSAKLKTN